MPKDYGLNPTVAGEKAYCESFFTCDGLKSPPSREPALWAGSRDGGMTLA
jgi:hypothetical protein